MQRAQMPCRTASLMVHRRLGIDVLCLMLAPVPCREVASTLMSMGMAWVGRVMLKPRAHCPAGRAASTARSRVLKTT